MTPLKPSEKRLLSAFGIAAFILLNLLGFSWYSKKKLVLERQRVTLETRNRELEFWRGQKPVADVKEAFLRAHLLSYPDEPTRDLYLENFVRKEVESLGLELKKPQIQAFKSEPLFHKSRFTAEVSGSWDGVLEFIYRLQQPGEFRFVSKLSLKSQKKEGGTDTAADVVCAFDIEKWWSPQAPPDAPESPAGLPETTAAAISLPDSEHSPVPVVLNQNTTAAIQ